MEVIVRNKKNLNVISEEMMNKSVQYAQRMYMMG
jgi:hypothetical protein